MRRDYDKKTEELSKVKLRVMGLQYELDQQITVMLNQNHKIEEQGKEYDREFNKKNFELERELKEVSKARFDLEGEVKAYDQELQKQNEENYKNKMTIIKEQAFDKVNNDRFQLEM